MMVIDLSEDYKKLYFVCLEDWSEEMKEAGDHKEVWYSKMKDKGLRVKLAVDDKGEIGGMIQYIPIEHSFVEGKDMYFINCIWVHGHDTSRRRVWVRRCLNQQRRMLGPGAQKVWSLGEFPYRSG